MALTVTNYDPNSTYLFGRQYSLVLGAPNQPTGLMYGNVGNSPAPLRISFDIDKNLFSSPNTSKIEIYNLSAQSRAAIKKGYIVTLDAGYKGILSRLFVGNVQKSSVRRSGPDIITTLECMDGASAITMATIDKSYGEGVSLVTILQDLVNEMARTTNLNPTPINFGNISGIPNQTFNKGYHAHGQVRQVITKLLKSFGLEWSVQNNQINILPIKATTEPTATLVSMATGMIDVPSQNDQFTQFKSLLNPKLTPGSLVQLSSENTQLNGLYKIRRSHFEGDTHDNKWQVSCELNKNPTNPNVNPTATNGDLSKAVIS